MSKISDYWVLVRAKKEAQASVTLRHEQFSVGPSSDGNGLYIAKQRKDEKIDAVNAIDEAAAKFIVNALIELYGDVVKP